MQTKTKWFLVMFAVSSIMMGQGQNAQQPITGKPAVTLTSATPLLTDKKNTAMDVSLHIDFAGQDKVWISGIGEVAGNGDLRFVALGKKLDVRTVKGGQLLESIDLTPTSIDQPPPASMDDLFPSMDPRLWTNYATDLDLHRPVARVAYALTKLTQNRSLPVVLSFTACHLNADDCTVSLWSTLSQNIDDMQVECSLMFNYKPKGSGAVETTAASLAFSTRDGFTNSVKWRATPSPDSIRKCQAFSEQVQNALLTLPKENGK